MDTNTLMILVQLLEARYHAPPSPPSTPLILTAIAPTLAALTACLLAWATRVKTQEIAASVDKVHTAVNSERTAMLAELKQAKEEILEISKKFATLEEKERKSEGRRR